MKIEGNTIAWGLSLITIFSPLAQTIEAANQTPQTINVCFVNLDNAGNILTSLPQNTSISINLFTDPGHLIEGQINSYGTTNIPISETSSTQANSDLSGEDGILDAYCSKQNFQNDVNHEYTYTQASISSNLDWLPIRYNDEISINYVHPDIAFPYSGEWFDNIAGNEAQRNTNADGHITMSSERSDRTLVVVSQLDQNLPTYAVKFDDSVTAANEYTLSTVPQSIQPGSVMNLRFSVQNMGTLKWLSSLDGTAINPVNVSYHWRNLDDDSLSQYNGNRAVINHDLDYTQNDSNIELTVNSPNAPGNYQLIIDLVHEGVTWFSAKGADTKTFNITIGTPVVATEPIVQPQAQPITTIRSSSPQAMTATLSSSTTYTVQPYSGNPNWHCGGYDCLVGIAEDFYHCSANGIPNSYTGTDINILKTQCWWPIYLANLGYWQGYIPPVYANTPWNYIEIGWILVIPANGTVPPPPSNPPVSNFNPSVPGSTSSDPYAGMTGYNYIWPQVTFDRWIAWDGSYKTDAIKWSETKRPNAPTITGISTSSDGTSATIFGVALPKNQPMGVAVWNEFRYCWACGSGWEYFYQQGYAQNVKVVLFKNNWQYIGQVWNDRADGRWSITLPVGSSINSGDDIFAEVQIEADFTFSGLHWWSNTTENVNFDLRNPKYTGYPYFGSGGSQRVRVPSIYVDRRSNEEKWIDWRATLLGATGASGITNVCGYPAKTYSNLKNGPGAIIFVNNRPIYSYGGTWDTFNYYGDKCSRFGVPINDPVEPAGTGPFNTPGAYQDFQKGRVYWSWKHQGKFTYGIISNKFEQAGGTWSSYGWPTSETYSIDENGTSTVCQNFEGGRICEVEPNQLTEAQQAFKQRFGIVYDSTPIVCGFESVSINGGIALYSKTRKEVKTITGVIYNTWISDCNRFGFPENDTSNVNSGYSSATGTAQRFNRNLPNVYDFYNSGFGLFVLEGDVRNLYESANGLGTVGFPKSLEYNDPERLRGICMDTEKGMICQSSYPEWYAPLKARVESIKETFNATTHYNLCSGGNYTAVKISNGIVYYDPYNKNTRVISGNIYTSWDVNQKGCDTYGLPENDTTDVTSGYSSEKGQDQRFNKDNLYVNDFYSSNFGTIRLEGVARNLYENAHGLGTTGFPKRVYDDNNRGRCVETEKETLCEKEGPPAPVCKDGEVVENGVCVEKKFAECHVIGMEKYVNPNDANDVTCAKINDFPYINQALDSTGGGFTTPKAGTVMCGANSIVMAIAGMGKISTRDFDQLKTYTYQDNDINPKSPPAYTHCDWVDDVFYGRHMYNVKGSWSYVANDWEQPDLSFCAASVWPYMQSYLQGFDLNADYIERASVGTLGHDIYMSKVKQSLVNGGGSIQAIYGTLSNTGYYEHIFLIKGYTDDNLDGKPDRVIVNDPWTNVLSDDGNYSFKGNGAIYSYQYTHIMNFGALITFNN